MPRPWSDRTGRARSRSSTPTPTGSRVRCGDGASSPVTRSRSSPNNQPLFVETVYACQRAGFRLTPINWHLTGDEASYIVDDCEAKALVTDAELVVRGAVRASPAAPACKVALVGGGRSTGSSPSRTRWPPKGPSRSQTRPPARRCCTRRARRAGPRACTVGGGVRGGRRVNLVRLRRGGRLRPPVHRAAVPRRAAGVLAGHAARLRRDRRAHGRVGRRGRAAAHRRAQGHPHAHGADDVPSAAVASR